MAQEQPIAILPIDLERPVYNSPLLNLIPGGSGLNMNKANFFLVIFSLLLDSMCIRQDTVVLQSKDLVANASIQDKLNKAMGQVKFAVNTPNMTQNQISAIQEQNMEASAIRSDLQNDLITARQTAQVKMTMASTNVNILTEEASENSAVIKKMASIFDAINSLLQGS